MPIDNTGSVKDSVTSFTNSFHNLIESLSINLDGDDDAEGLSGLVTPSHTPDIVS